MCLVKHEANICDTPSYLPIKSWLWIGLAGELGQESSGGRVLIPTATVTFAVLRSVNCRLRRGVVQRQASFNELVLQVELLRPCSGTCYEGDAELFKCLQAQRRHIRRVMRDDLCLIIVCTFVWILSGSAQLIKR